MNLIVTTQHREHHLAFRVQGNCSYDNLLALAATMREAALRTECRRLLLDLTQLRGHLPAEQMEAACAHFAGSVCDSARLAIVCRAARGEGGSRSTVSRPAASRLSAFGTEMEARDWLRSDRAHRHGEKSIAQRLTGFGLASGLFAS